MGLISFKPCLFCPFQKVRCVPRNFNKIKTVGHKKCQYQWLQKAVGRARAIFQCFGLLFLFSTILEAPSFSDKRMNMLDTFSIAFNKNIADSKAKLFEKLAQQQQEHFSFNFIYSYMNCRQCVTKVVPDIFQDWPQFSTCTDSIITYFPT